MMFSSSSRVGMKLYISIFQCLLVVIAKDGHRTDGMTGGAPPVEIQPPIRSSKHFIFQLYLTPPSFMMFSSSSKVGMKLCISIFQCLCVCLVVVAKNGRRTDGLSGAGPDEIQPPIPSSKHLYSNST